jgi:hypothetical protein
VFQSGPDAKGLSRSDLRLALLDGWRWGLSDMHTQSTVTSLLEVLCKLHEVDIQTIPQDSRRLAIVRRDLNLALGKRFTIKQTLGMILQLHRHGVLPR